MILTIICAVIGSGALSTVISAVIAAATRRRDKDDAVMLLLYHAIKNECKDYISAGEIDSDEIEVLIKMHETYHKRGGNGYLDKLMSECKQLPVVN